MKQLFTLVHLVQDLVTPHVLEYMSNIMLEPQWLLSGSLQVVLLPGVLHSDGRKPLGMLREQD